MQFLLAPLTYFGTLFGLGIPGPLVAAIILFILVAILNVLIALL